MESGMHIKRTVSANREAGVCAALCTRTKNASCELGFWSDSFAFRRPMLHCAQQRVNAKPKYKSNALGRDPELAQFGFRRGGEINSRRPHLLLLPSFDALCMYKIPRTSTFTFAPKKEKCPG